MQKIVFKREFFILFETVKTENVQYLEEKIQPIKIIVIKKNPEKIALNLNFKKSRLIFEKKISSRCPYSISIPKLASVGLPV